MMLKKLGILLPLLFVTGLSAQTPSYRIQWDQDEPPATAQTNQYTLITDALPAVVLNPTCVAQVGNPNTSTCTAPLAKTGKSYIVTAFNGFGSASSMPLTGTAPAIAVNIKVVVTVTVP